MKNLMLLSIVALALNACATDKHAHNYNPQKMMDAISAKYPADKNTLIFVEAPEGFVAPGLANCAVKEGVDNADVVAINSALALKTTTVIVAGDNESLTATTLAQALKTGKDTINGGKLVLVNTNATSSKDIAKTLADLATASGVALELIDNPS